LLGGTPRKALAELRDFAPVPEVVLLIIAAAFFLAGNLPAHPFVAHWMRGVAILAVAFMPMRHLQYGVSLYRNLYPVRYIEYYVPGVTLYAAAVVASWWKNTRGTVIWKGREYPAGTP